ncbi:SagB/ThcOx family dehydrogenase [Candidatus Kaiserbacteria bacterium]|nr:SagB/ThcOx family dehydrogenase [Candidatus Kaiserbacteria bacterium]
MDDFIPSIHEYIRKNQHRLTQPPNATNGPKRYERMEVVPLPEPLPLKLSLAEALEQRKSRKEFSGTPVSLSALSSLLYYAAHKSGSGRRPYPSGGGLYPIEIYVISFTVENCERILLHYEPDTHVLRQLWKLPDDASPSSYVKINGDASPTAVIVCTAAWDRSAQKYRDFAYVLSLLEAGHLSQNILIVSEALSLATCPLGALNDDVIITLLDVDSAMEQPVSVIVLGNRFLK